MPLPSAAMMISPCCSSGYPALAPFVRIAATTPLESANQ